LLHHVFYEDIMNAEALGSSTEPPGNDAAPKPTIEAIQRDIALANTYRIELIKYLLAIAAALLAFTVTFRPTLWRVDLAWAMWCGWFGLGLSLIGGMFHMLGWDHYYKSYRDYDHKGKAQAGKAARHSINQWRRSAMILQFGGFIIGVAGVALFAAANIDNAGKHETHQESGKPTVPR
jgi:hypothetical protein